MTSLGERLKALVVSPRANKSSQELRQDIATIKQKRAAAQARLDNHSRLRDQAALAAALGNSEVQSALDVAAAEIYGLELAVGDNDRALSQLAKDLAEAEKAEAAAKLKARVDAQAQALVDCLAGARGIEATLRDLAQRLTQFHDAVGRARAGLLEATAGERFPNLVLTDLEPAELTRLFARHMLALGIAAPLGVALTGLNPQPVPSLVEAVRTLTRRAELTPAGVSRVLHPEQSKAA